MNETAEGLRHQGRGEVLEEGQKDYLDILERRMIEENLAQQAARPDLLEKDPRVLELADKLEAADAARRVVEKRKEELRPTVGMSIGDHEGRVVLDFGQQVSNISMEPKQAVKVGRALIKHARKALKGG